MPPEADNSLIVHVFGETDFTSLSIDKSRFEDRETPVFDSPEGDEYVQVLGALFGNERWEELKDKTTENGMSYHDLVAGTVASLLSGTETVKFALARGYNLVALGVFRANKRSGAQTYSARFLGTSMTSSLEPRAHLELVREGSKAMAPFVVEDIDNGKIAEDSILARLITGEEDIGIAEETEEESEDALPVSTFFHEMVTERGLETVIVCACDSAVAGDIAQVGQMSVGLVSGIIPTPHGSVGYWLWHVCPDTPAGFLQEQFIDLGSLPSSLYDRMKRSETIRFLVVDRATQENTGGVFLATRSIGLEEFEAMAVEIAASEENADFEAACEHVMATVEPEDFLRQAEKNQGSGHSNLH